MKTFPLYNRPDGSLRGFEINNTWIWIGTLQSILQSVPGVSEIKRVHFLEEKVKFLLHGEPCVVWEPFGDNSRYWIGPADAESSKADLNALHQAFVAHQSPFTRFLVRARLLYAG